VLEHVPDPTKVLDEFARLLKSGGKLILSAPFASLVHFAPYHYCSGFSSYWYEHHLPQRGFQIEELTPN
jgi:ubiquinone/menaquinone biosynthesis C-methylase UbiE